MRDGVTTSWKRLSDELRNHADSGNPYSARTLPLHVQEAQQLEAWEDDGGMTALSTELVRILIVDNDIKSTDSLELMLRTLGYSRLALLTPATPLSPSPPNFSPTWSCSSSVSWI